MSEFPSIEPAFTVQVGPPVWIQEISPDHAMRVTIDVPLPVGTWSNKQPLEVL